MRCMQTIKEYNQKLSRLRTARKITRTMKLIAVTRMRRAQEARQHAALYAGHLNRIIGDLGCGGRAAGRHALCRTPPNAESRTLLVLISGDRGLCGSFNSGLMRVTHDWLASRTPDAGVVEVAALGRRGALYGRTHGWIMRDYAVPTSRPQFRDAARVGNELQTEFRAGRYREIYLAFNRVIPPLRVKPALQRWLPFSAGEHKAEKGEAGEFIVEPDREELFETILPQAANFMLYLVLLNSAAGEHTLRMMAMDAATSNADELIESTTMLRNRVRHAAITRELLEIISGAEVLRN